MRSLKLIIFVLVAVSASSCQSPLNVNTDYDESFDFSGLVTFRWHVDNQHNQSSKNYLNNDLVDRRIRLNVENQLSTKGVIEWHQFQKHHNCRSLKNYLPNSKNALKYPCLLRHIQVA